MLSSLLSECKQLFKLAVPLTIAQLAQALTGLGDTLMMGRLGTSTLAAGGLASITFMTLITVMGGIVMAVTPLVAEADGKGLRLRNITAQGFWIVVILSLPSIMIIGKSDRLLVSSDPTILALANTYLDIMVWACFPALGFMLLRGIISGLSKTRPIMIIVLGGTTFNLLGNYLLAFGKLGFPRLEIAGLAIASVVSLWGMFVALAIYTVAHPQLRSARLFARLHRLHPALLMRLAKLGVPIGVFIALESGLFAVVTYLMGALGTTTLAAHQIVLQTIVILFMIPLGISSAATIRVGQWLGRGNPQKIRQAGYSSVTIGLIFSLITAIAICWFPQLLIGLYLDLNDGENLPVIGIAVPMLRIGVVALILDGMQKIVYGILQGLQDTKIPVLLSIPAFWGIGLGVGYLLGFPLGMGGVGLWLGQSLGLAIAAVLFFMRFILVVRRLPAKSPLPQHS